MAAVIIAPLDAFLTHIFSAHLDREMHVTQIRELPLSFHTEMFGLEMFGLEMFGLEMFGPKGRGRRRRKASISEIVLLITDCPGLSCFKVLREQVTGLWRWLESMSAWRPAGR